MNNWIRVSDQAPPENRPVLASYRTPYGYAHVIRATYYGSLQLPLDGDAECDEGEYDEATDTVYCPPGWYETNEHEETYWRVDAQVSHWMELPDPPER